MSSGFFETDLKDNVVLKRGSMYQSSSEVQRMQRLRYDRTKKEMDVNDDAFLSFDFNNSSSLGSSKETLLFTEQMSVPIGMEKVYPSVDSMHLISKDNVEFLDLSLCDLPEERSKISISCSDAGEECSISSDSLLRICLQMREFSNLVLKTTPESFEKAQIEEKNCNRNQLVNTGVDADKTYERSEICILPKSFSAKLGNSYLSFHSWGEVMKSISKNRSSPLKKMLDPIMKSKSQRNLSPLSPETSRSTILDAASLCEVKSLPKSVSSDFSKGCKKIDNDCKPSAKKNFIQTATSAAHLQAILKWELNSGVPFYEFLVKDPEDVLCAKTWKSDNDLNCVYTFHSCPKSGTSSPVAKGQQVKQSTMIGQMQFSCCLHSDVSQAERFCNYLLAEFTLYDIALGRRTSAIERCSSPSGSNQAIVAETLLSDNPFNSTRLLKTKRHQLTVRRKSSDCSSEPSMFYPCSLSNLHSNLELAAIIVQIPFNKKGALKDVQWAVNGNTRSQGLSSACAADQAEVSNFNNLSAADVKVVTPSGAHGLPDGEEARASSLLDRWRFGGGCDCGGWDMGCPIVVFDANCNSNVDSTKGTHKLISLFAKGKKEKLPALSITAIEKGQYAIDFHAQLSALQAFSVCVALLHSSEASLAICQEKKKHKLHPDSLKLLLEEDVTHTTEAASAEKRKIKKIEPLAPSFFFDPPFSPMARV
ncbi:hypothetical protein HPP92_004697 [Vanilla planifolia]|nr:hypothetical protein HPP92_004697 [Vanilla planifolia]